MTPDEHRARAEQLTVMADDHLDLIEASLDNRTPVDDSDWRTLDARMRLAHLHFDAARAGTPNPGAHVPTNERLDMGAPPRDGYPYGDMPLREDEPGR